MVKRFRASSTLRGVRPSRWSKDQFSSFFSWEMACRQGSCRFCSKRGSSFCRVSFRSPRRAWAGEMFLESSAPSMSIWTIWALVANFSRLPVTRSLKRTPRAMMQSAWCIAMEEA